jgi:ribosomal protein S12 methylthiotransferase
MMIRSIALAVLGCSKNIADSEHLLGILEKSGMLITAHAEEAEAIVVATCGFLDSARREAIETIQALNEYRKTGRLRRLVVTGCMADKDREMIRNECPFVDAMLSPFDFSRAVEVICGEDHRESEPVMPARDPLPRAEVRKRITPVSYAYIKLADGCDNRCTYCRIPYLRGSFRSKRPADVIWESRRAIRSGAREIVLISQDTSRYGADLGMRSQEKSALIHLLKGLLKIRNIFRIRLMYLYPSSIPDELLEMMSDEPRICSYLDIPLQHVSGKVLKAMHRWGNPADIRKVLAHLKSKVPGIVLRTTLMTGFPGETPADFAELVQFVSEGWVDHLGVFTYSPEPDTEAGRWKTGISPDDAEARRRELMEIQFEHVCSRNRSMIGSDVLILVDEIQNDPEPVSIGRSDSQAPEVDSCIRIKGERILPGTILPVRISDFLDYDLMGEPIIWNV